MTRLTGTQRNTKYQSVKNCAGRRGAVRDGARTCAGHAHTQTHSEFMSLEIGCVAAKQPLPACRRQEHQAAPQRLQRRGGKGLVPPRGVIGPAAPLQQVAGGRHAHHPRQRARRVADAPAGCGPATGRQEGRQRGCRSAERASQTASLALRAPGSTDSSSGKGSSVLPQACF